jgi:chromobox protein 1
VVEWKPPPGSWEDLVTTLDAAQDETTNGLIVYLDWKDGHRTKHPTEVIYKRCPQKVSSRRMRRQEGDIC